MMCAAQLHAATDRGLALLALQPLSVAFPGSTTGVYPDEGRLEAAVRSWPRADGSCRWILVTVTVITLIIPMIVEVVAVSSTAEAQSSGRLALVGVLHPEANHSDYWRPSAMDCAGSAMWKAGM